MEIQTVPRKGAICKRLQPAYAKRERREAPTGISQVPLTGCKGLEGTEALEVCNACLSNAMTELLIPAIFTGNTQCSV